MCNEIALLCVLFTPGSSVLFGLCVNSSFRLFMLCIIDFRLFLLYILDLRLFPLRDIFTAVYSAVLRYSIVLRNG